MIPLAFSSDELSSTASTVASATISGTCTSRMTSVFFSALRKAGSSARRPQVTDGRKVQGACRVDMKESPKE